jgi:hypothetical protein
MASSQVIQGSWQEIPSHAEELEGRDDLVLIIPSREVPHVGSAPKAPILPGSGKGLFVMANDFDDPLPEFSEYM